MSGGRAGAESFIGKSAPSPEKIMIKLKNAHLGYKKATVLHDVSVNIDKGDFVGLIGPNGAGKTTFLKTIMGLIEIKEGIFEYSGDIKFGYCMQRDFLSNIFPFTVLEIVLMMRTRYGRTFKGYSLKDRRAVDNSLEKCGIGHLANSKFYNLSGGQQQRVLIARALALEPDILVLDEPTIDLDVKGKKEILDLVSSLYAEHGMTVLLVSHELNQVINYAEKFLFFADNRCFGVYRKNELSSKIISKIFDTEIKMHMLENKIHIMI